MELPQRSTTRYDEAARYLLLQTDHLLFDWLLPSTRGRFRFDSWGRTQLTLPNVRQRICDGIAFLGDRSRSGVPVAALVEIQTTPDIDMPGRLLLAGGLLWLTTRPSTHPGDRYELLSVVLNLTGVGKASFDHDFGGRWLLEPVERNLETMDAGKVLEEVASGLAPPQLLAFIPLMQGSGGPDILQRWRQLVTAEPDRQRRADSQLALVFAERVGRLAEWEAIMEDLTFIESPMIAALLDRNRAEARVDNQAESLRRLLRRRWGTLPTDLVAVIETCRETATLERWFDLAIDATSLANFRELAGL